MTQTLQRPDVELIELASADEELTCSCEVGDKPCPNRAVYRHTVHCTCGDVRSAFTCQRCRIVLDLYVSRHLARCYGCRRLLAVTDITWSPL